MGRFYKTSRANHIDYAFKLPVSYIANAVANTDRQINTTIKSADIVKQSIENEKTGALSLNYSPQDEALFNKKIAAHEQAINDITKNIIENPLDSYKQRINIAQAQTNLRNDIVGGTLGKINQNATYLQEFLKNNQSANPTTLNTMLEYGLNKWGSSFDNNNQFRNIRDYLPTKISNVDVSTQANKLANQFKASGVYDNKTISRATAFKDVSTNIENNLMGNEDVKQSIYQKIRYGVYGSDIADLPEEKKQNFIENKIKEAAQSAAFMTLHPKLNSPRAVRTPIGDRQAISAVFNSTAPVENSVYNDIIKLKDNSNNITLPELVKLRIEYNSNIQNIEHNLNIPDSNVSEDDKLNLIALKLKSVQVGNYIEKLSKNNNNAINLSNIPINNNSTSNGSTTEFTYWPTEINNVPVTNSMQAEYKKNLKKALDINYANTPIVSSNKDYNGKTINELIKDGVITPVVKNQKAIDTKISQIQNVMTLSNIAVNNTTFSITNPSSNLIRINYKVKDNNGNISPTHIDITKDFAIGKYNGFKISQDKFEPPTNFLYEGSPLVGVKALVGNKPTKLYFKLSNLLPELYGSMTQDKKLISNYKLNTIINTLNTTLPNDKSISLTTNGSVKLGKNANGQIYLSIGENSTTDINQIKRLLMHYVNKK